ncbi:hypothetical protein AB0I28_22695 [Phytomonospora sp. NPDC050363]|uniref:hypothetical protein n=1 Tax=Phytomonospora sp. NPDC050363 TaxID=3155642 RepID=UPI0034037E4D
MKEELGGYETRLLAELTEVVEERAAKRASWFTMPRLAMGGVALAAVAVAAGLTMPVFGGASERSPDGGAVAVASEDIQPAGFSMALSNDGKSVTVTIDDIRDDKGLEAALKEKGVDSNVVVLDGVHWDCQWPEYEPLFANFGGGHDDNGGALFTLTPSDLAGKVLLIAVYNTMDDDGNTVERPLVGLSVSKSDPGDCVGIDKP